MALPREPRQKMINMMYLVLTALLALNVSSEILNAFKTVNKSLETTNAVVTKSTDNIMKSLEDKLSDSASATKARIWYPKAQQVTGLSKPLFDYIQSLKDRILKEAGGDPKDPNKKFKEDNLDVGTRIMIEKGEGPKLKKMLEEYKSNLLAVDPSIDSAFNEKLGGSGLAINTEKPKSSNRAGKTWEGAYFHMVPTVAALTILSKFQMDVKSSENKVVQFCHNKVGEVKVRYDTYAAFAQTNSSYVMPGDEMEVVAGVGAFSKAALPTVTIDGQNIALESDGAAHRKITASAALGKHTINVTVKFKDQDGKEQVINKPIEYTVGQSAASIALDKMNVLYIGVDNPITISATGGGTERMQVKIEGGGGTLTPTGGGKYNARVSSVTDECMITVFVDGRKAGAAPFRTRTIPKPEATIGGVTSGDNMTVGQLRAQTGVGAYIKDFPFDLKYTVTSFTLSCENDDGDLDVAEVQGFQFDKKCQDIFKRMKPGRTVTVDQIYAMGPDGRRQHLPSIVYYTR